MISGHCECGQPFSIAEAEANKLTACEVCQRKIFPVAAEPLGEGNGEGDFDARMILVAGPAGIGSQIFLGGVVDIEIGKLQGKHIQIIGPQVSRNHAKLGRLDFGPSRWKIVDTQSTNGVFVNGTKVTEQELQDGDTITIGDFDFKFTNAPVAPEAAAEAAVSALEEVAQAEDASVPPPLAQGRAMASAAAVMPPPARMPGVGGGRAINYASAGAHAPGERLLGDCDIDWVMKLRNASQLMVLVLGVNFLNRWFVPEFLESAVDALAALMSVAASWLLTAPEPGAPESESWFSIRIFLRVFATITAAGTLMTLALNQFAHESFGQGLSPMRVLSSLLVLSVVPETALFLYYLRRLALRIPSPGLAINAMIVMIGLPSVLLLMLGGGFFALAKGSPVAGLVSLCGGLIGLLVFRLWYIALLIWFNKSFS